MLSLFVLAIGTAISALLTFFVQVLTARLVDPAAFGNFSSALLFTTTLSPLCGFGVSQLLLKLYGQHGKAADVIVPSTLQFVVISTFATLCLLGISGALMHSGSSIELAATLVLSLVVLGNLAVELTGAILQLQGKYALLSGWQFMLPLLRCLAVLGAAYVVTDVSELTLATAFAVASLCIVLIGGVPIFRLYRVGVTAYKKKDVLGAGSFPSYDLKRVAREAYPFGVSTLFYLLYNQFGVVMVRQLVTPDAAGFYSVAYTLIGATLLFPGVVYQKFLLPKLHRWAYHDELKLRQVYVRGNYLMAATGVGVAFPLWLMAPILIPLVFGEAYVEAIPLTKVLAFSIPLVFIAASCGAPLVTGENMLIKVKIMGVSALLNILLNIFLLPIFGAMGAVTANIVCSLFLLISYAWASQKYVFRPTH